MKEIFEGWIARDRNNGLLFADTKPYISQWADTDSKRRIDISPALGEEMVIDLKFGGEAHKAKITIEIE